MSDPLALTDASRRLVDALPRGQPWRLADSLSLVARLAEQVQTLHQAGRTHRAIGIEAVTLVGSQSVQLDPPPTARRFGRDDADPECCPPELAEVETLTLPESIAAATQILRRHGCPVDPRRIDVYQLGVLLCRLLTGKPLRAYLLDPLTKAGIAAVARPILEQALGYDSPARYEHCGPLLAALRTAVDQCGPDAPQAEQRDEERSDRASGDSSALGTSPHGSPLDANVDTPPTRTTPAATPSRLQAELPCARLAHFRLLRRIGHGGMGDVYEAHDESLDRRVAVKVLPDDLARDETLIARFRAEAWAVAHLQHPHVVPVHFIGEDRGHHFFVMRLIDGESLAQRLARERCLPLPEALRIVEQCLDGLEAAHAQDLIHRDIKPSNIMLEAGTGRVVLVDFGLVRRIDQSLLITATGLIMGTLDYLSPEQARGRPADARSDLYSLGVVLYQMLAGRLPFTAETPTGMLFQHAYEPPFPLAEAVPDLPAPMVQMVERLMAKDPAERHQSCAEVRTDLRAFQDGRPLAAEGRRQSPNAARSSELRGPNGATAGMPQGVPAADQPALPTDLERGTPRPRRQPVRDWAGTLFRRHAPEFVTELQSTTQQVDGAVAQYERRCRRLSELLAEGRRIAAELAAQLRVNQELAARAEQAACAAGDPDERQVALTQQQAHQANHASLQSQVQQQAEDVEELVLEQCRAEAALARLRSQRDALQARLTAAAARGATRTDPARWSRRRWLAAAALTGSCLILGVLLVVLRPDLREPSSTPLRSKTETTAETTTVPPKVATLPAQTATASAAPPPAIAPFDEKQAKEHQAAWAKHLGVPLEMTNLPQTTAPPPTADTQTAQLNPRDVSHLVTREEHPEFVVFRFQGEINAEAYVPVVDEDGRVLWVPSHKGLLRYDLDTDRWSLSGPAEGLPGALVYQLRLGKGVVLMDVVRWTAAHSHTSVGTFLWNSRGTCIKVEPNDIAVVRQFGPKPWIWRPQGLIVPRPALDTFQVYPNDKSDLLHRSIGDTVLVGQDIWIAHYGDNILGSDRFEGGGISCVNGITGKVRHYTEKDGLTNNYCCAIACDGQRVWVAHGFPERGLSVFDLAEEKWTTLQKSKNGVPLGGVQLAATAGGLWIAGSHEGVLIRLDTSTQLATSFGEAVPGTFASVAVGLDAVWASAHGEKRSGRGFESGVVRFPVRTQ
ncbi:MAG: protein kinase [Planctomycetota bacterium]|nr:protein kinase [Planctomycetota bacterium]